MKGFVLHRLHHKMLANLETIDDLLGMNGFEILDRVAERAKAAASSDCATRAYPSW